MARSQITISKKAIIGARYLMPFEIYMTLMVSMLTSQILAINMRRGRITHE
jgi:hypothetical protein